MRRLPSVETLGAVDVICLDKTGTLTQGSLKLSRVEALGVEPAKVLRTAVLACDRVATDPLDRALVHGAAESVDVPSLQAVDLLVDYPFNPATRTATKILCDGERYEVVAKGAVEALLAAISLNELERNTLLAVNDKMADSGMRVIAVARGELVELPASRKCAEEALRIIGFLGFSDPVRENARDFISGCATAGVRAIMITGDHPATALSVAREVALPATEASVLSGDGMVRFSDEELASRINRISVFARIRPEQKLRIIRALHARGHVVAMTGDGTNDALALREADIGVAMGRRKTEVARNAAQLILRDDNISTIGRAIRDGRRIYENLRHAVRYLIAFHVPLILVSCIVPIMGLPLILMPVHLVWLELIVHPTASLVFEADRIDERIMRRPPRRRSHSLLSGRAWVRPVLLGLTLSIAVISIYIGFLRTGTSVESARASAMLTMITGSLFLVVVERAAERSFGNAQIFQNPLWLSISGATLLSMAVAIYLPPVARMLEFAVPDPWHLAVALVAGCVATMWYALLEAGKRKSVHPC